MSIKDDIRKKAGLEEATTIRLGGEDIEFDKEDMSKMKEEMERALNELTDMLTQKDLSREQANKQAKIFARNYLKGVYGK